MKSGLVRQGQEVSFRLATAEDCRNLWLWRNDPQTRLASYSTAPIPFEEHHAWFMKRLVSTDTQIWMILNEAGTPIGYLRFRLEGQEAQVSIGLDPQQRGRGYGPSALRVGVQRLLCEGKVRRVIALVKTSNEASRKAFERAGFSELRKAVVSGVDSIQMRYP